MAEKNVNILPGMPSSKPIIFNEEKCIGCNKCVEICQVDVFIPSMEKDKKAPSVLYPGECWYCGNCVVVCPVEGAIELRHPLMNQAHWIEKSALNKEK